MDQKVKNGLKISLVVLLVACLGLLSQIPEPEKAITLPEESPGSSPGPEEEPTSKEPSESEEITPEDEESPISPKSEESAPEKEFRIHYLDISFNLHGTHGSSVKYSIRRLSDSTYLTNKGQEIDADLIRELAESFTDFHESQKYEGIDEHYEVVLGEYVHIKVTVTLENGETLIIDSKLTNDQCCLIPWNIQYNNSHYIQVNGKIPSALFKILRELDEEVRARYDKEARWGCYPCELSWDHYDLNLSEDFPQSEPVITPLEETGKTHVLWEVFLPSTISPPVFSKGRVYVITKDYVYCLHMKLKRIVWGTKVGKGIDSVKGDLIICEGFVYAAVPHDSVYGLDIQTGVIRWKYPLDGKYTSLEMERIEDKLIVWGEEEDFEDKLFCLNRENGKRLWEITNFDKVEELCDDKIVIWGERDKNYFDTVVDIHTRDILWEQDSLGTLYLDYHDGVLYFDDYEKGRLRALDIITGEEIWSYDYGRLLLDQYNVHAECFAHERGVLLNVVAWLTEIEQSWLILLDENGSKQWEYTYDETDYGLLYPFVNDAYVYEDIIYVLRSGGFIEAFNRNGEKLWEKEVRGYTIESFKIYENHIYAIADCKVYCLDVKTGEILWELIVCDNLCEVYIGDHYECTCGHPVHVSHSENGVFFVGTEDSLTAVSVEPVNDSSLLAFLSPFSLFYFLVRSLLF